MSSQSMSVTLPSMMMATTTSAMWEAYSGTAAASGTTASAARNRRPTTSAVMPVRPPSSTPVADSMYVVTVDVPSIPPTVVPMASAISGLSMSGRLPSSSRKPATWPTPVSVPAVSKKSTKKNVNTTSENAKASTFPNPSRNAPTSGVMSYCGFGMEGARGVDGWGLSAPMAAAAQPATLVRTTPPTMEPGMPRAYSASVRNRPTTEMMATGSWAMLPSVMSVAGSSTTTYISSRPMMARNSPIPVPTANFTGSGNRRMMYSRAPMAVRMMKMIPSVTTAASAVCHGMPSAPTTVNAKKAFSPRPGAWPNGRFAYNPMMRVATAAAMMVTTASIERTAAGSNPWMMMPGFASGMPARMAGLTTTM